MEPLNEQQMRALEMRAESLRHLSTVALTLAGALGAVAGTVLKDMDPRNLVMAAGAFLLTALFTLNGQEAIIRQLETGKEARHKIQFPTIPAQGLFGVGWAILVFQGAKLVS